MTESGRDGDQGRDRINRLRWEQKHHEREIDDTRERIADWHRLRKENWRHQRGQSISKTAFVGAATSVMSKREIKKERRHLQGLYTRVHGLEDEIQEEMQRLDQAEKERAEEVEDLRKQVREMQEASALDRQKIETLYADLQRLEQDRDSFEEGLAKTQSENDRLYEELAGAKQELEECRRREEEQYRQARDEPEPEEEGPGTRPHGEDGGERREWERRIDEDIDNIRTEYPEPGEGEATPEAPTEFELPPDRRRRPRRRPQSRDEREREEREQDDDDRER